jgi:hypothetical protein
MSGTSAPAAPPAAPPPDRVAVHTVLALSVVEGKRLLRHPALLAGLAGGAVFALGIWRNGEPLQAWEGQNYEMFLLYWAPLYLGAFLAANTAALREGGRTTAEMFAPAPTRYPERTLALLIAGLVPTLIAAILASVHLQIIRNAGGITLNFIQVVPSPVEMALVPATTAASFAGGVAFARTIKSRTIAAAVGAVAAYALYLMYWAFGWFPAYFLVPYATARREVDLGETASLTEQDQWVVAYPPDEYHSHWWAITRNTDIVGWHVVYLLGVTLLLAAYAVRRSGRDFRVKWLLLGGALLAAVGLALQMAAAGGPFGWWDALPPATPPPAR